MRCSKKGKSRLVLPHETASPLALGNYLTLPTSNDTTVLDDLQAEVVSEFSPKKGASQQLAQVYKAMGLDVRAFRVKECGSYLEYHVTEHDKRLHMANFCKDRLCPMCNWRRSLKIFAQVSKVMDVLEPSGYQFLFLTLTVKNCVAADLPATCQLLFDGWRKLYHKKSVFKQSIAGTFRSLEVTRNTCTGEYHPHLHVILAVTPDYFSGRNYISQSRWCKLWQSCCGLDYVPVVDVRKVKPNAKGLAGAVAEVSKYAVKSADYLRGSVDDQIEQVYTFLSALTGRRLCSFTGVFASVRKQLALDDIEDGDLIHVDGEDLRPDIAYMVVRYAWRAGVYVRLEEP